MKKDSEPKKNNLWAFTLLLVVAIAAMLFIGKCSSKPQSPFDKEYVKAQGDTLDIGIELNPTIYYPQDDSLAGRDYEILQEISREHGIPMRFHPFVPINQAMDYLDKGLYDVVVASLPTTADMKDRFIMTEPIYLDREVLVQRMDSAGSAPVKSQLQLGGDTVWIANQGSKLRLENLSHEIGDTIHTNSDDSYTAEHLFLLVASGIIDKAVINERIAKSLVKDYPNVDISTPISFTQFQSWAVSKDNKALADSLNAWIKQINDKNE